jgi:hypothetical protein
MVRNSAVLAADIGCASIVRPERFVLVLLSLAGAASAEAEGIAVDSALPRNVLSLEPAAFFSGGMEIDGERYFLSHRLSLVLALGGKGAAGGNYSSWSISTGAAVRFWFEVLQLPFSHHAGGPFVGGRVDGAFDELTDQLNGGRARSIELAGSLRAGYRFVFFDHFEVTPEAGIAVTMDIAGNPLIAGSPRLSWVYGGTFGCLF